VAVISTSARKRVGYARECTETLINPVSPGRVTPSQGRRAYRRRVTGSTQGDQVTASTAGGGRGDRGRWALPRGLIVLLGLAAGVAVGAGVQVMAWLIGPMFLALTIVISVGPLQACLRRQGVPQWAATLALVLAVYAVLIGMTLVLVVSVAQLATVLPRYADRAEELVASAASVLSRFGVGPDQLSETARSLDWERLVTLAGSLLSGLAGLASNIVFLLTLLLFLCTEASGVNARLQAIGRDRPEVARALSGFAVNTRKYMVVSTVFGLIVAVLDTIALTLMGIPLAATWGLLAFITNYIPNVGFVLGVIPPAVLGLLEGGPGLMVAVIVVYSVLNFVVQSLIQPRFVGDSVGLSVVVTFLALVFWAWLIGPLGAVLAIPLTLLAKAMLVDIDPSASWADALLRNRPATPPQTREPEPGAPGQGPTSTGGDAAPA
jgi:AI-2 transport protein TqsA